MSVGCSHPSRQAQEMVKRCCRYTWQSTCSTMGSSAQACECQNAGRQCTGCHCWGKCRNNGRVMPFPTTARGLLGHFPQGSDPPANNSRATTPPVRLPTSSFLRAILAARAGGRSAWGGASGRRGPREVGRGGEEEAESEGWSGGSDATSDVETEEDEGGHASLTVSPCGTQESGERGQQGDVRAGGSNSGKGTSTTADGGRRGVLSL